MMPRPVLLCSTLVACLLLVQGSTEQPSNDATNSSAANATAATDTPPPGIPGNGTDPEKPRPWKPKPGPKPGTVKPGHDLDPDNVPCQQEITDHCSFVSKRPGNLRLLSCLERAGHKTRKALDEKMKPFSSECREEVKQFRLNMTTSGKAEDVTLMRKCTKDMRSLCGHTLDPLNTTRPDGLPKALSWHATLECLKRNASKLQTDCKEAVFHLKRAAAEDLRFDPKLMASCSDDIKKHCRNVRAGDAKLRGCLLKKLAVLNATCKRDLLENQKENADDIRLNHELHKHCRNDLTKFCPKIQAGGSRQIACLQSHMDQQSMSTECHHHLVAFSSLHLGEIGIDPRVSKHCAGDIKALCRGVPATNGSLLECLKRNMTRLQAPLCKQEIFRVIKASVQDIRIDRKLLTACSKDLDTLCPGITGMQGITCLKQAMKNLTKGCASKLFTHDVVASRDINFKPKLKSACSAEIESFCGSVPHGSAAVIACLADARLKAPDTFSQGCAKEISNEQVHMNSDVRLNFRLRQSCRDDIRALCPHVNTSTVIRCLRSQVSNITSDTCKEELLRVQQHSSENLKVNKVAFDKCAQDVQEFCAGVPSEGGRLLQCLERHKSKLSVGCDHEIMSMAKEGYADNRIIFGLTKHCALERSQFCAEVAAAKILPCLEEHVNEEAFGHKCKQAVVKEQQKRLVDWRLDPELKKACASDTQRFCSQKSWRKEYAINTCLLHHVKDLSKECTTAFHGPVRTALTFYVAASPFTKDCDSDAEKFCNFTSTNHSKLLKSPQRAEVGNTHVGMCLLAAVFSGAALTDRCQDIVILSVPEVNGVSASATHALISTLHSLSAIKNLDSDSIVLSGPLAMAAMVALLVVMVIIGVLVCTSKKSAKAQGLELPVVQFVPKSS